MSDFITVDSNCGTVQIPYVQEMRSFGNSVTTGHIPYFHSLLCNWATSIPRQYHWVVVIDPISESTLKNHIRSTLANTLEPSLRGSWDISDGYDATYTSDNMTKIGCIFATGYGSDGEGYEQDKTSGFRGFMTSPLSKPRKLSHTFKIIFRETNASFLDSFIKPWIIVANHMGAMARKDSESIKANITVYELGLTGFDSENQARKITTYYDCLPFSIALTELKMDSQNNDGLEVQFMYNYYTIKTIGGI